VATNDLKALTGQQKAAIMILAIGEDRASRLFGMLDEEELKELSQAMANLGTVDSKTIEALFVEFASLVAGTGSLVGSYASAERLLAKSLSADKVAEIMEDIRGPAGRTMWDKLNNVNDSILAQYFRNEYPQTVAVVLSKLRSDQAARVLGELPDDFSSEVMQRMLTMGNVQKEVLNAIENTLREEFMATLSNVRQRDQHELMAEIFNSFDRASEQKFMGMLEERSRESAERVKALMFTFDDLQKLDPQGVQTLLRHVEKTQLALALKGASETIRDLFFSNMSERQGKILREDMDAMGPVRLREVDEAQAEIVSRTKDLADSGEIVIAEASGEDELVY
jgi:flagellar motor switch protein FliG